MNKPTSKKQEDAITHTHTRKGHSENEKELMAIINMVTEVKSILQRLKDKSEEIWKVER